MRFLSQLTDIPTLDPEDARRRRLLNILLVGTFGATVLLVLWIVLYGLLGWAETEADFWQPLLGTLGMLVGIVIIFILNRSGSARVAAWLFLVIVTIVGAFTDPDLGEELTYRLSTASSVPTVTYAPATVVGGTGSIPALSGRNTLPVFITFAPR